MAWQLAKFAEELDALKKADWLVVGEIYPEETSEFWKVSWDYS